MAVALLGGGGVLPRRRLQRGPCTGGGRGGCRPRAIAPPPPPAGRGERRSAAHPPGGAPMAPAWVEEAGRVGPGWLLPPTLAWVMGGLLPTHLSFGVTPPREPPG